jgi:NADH-quinone oxidoreductase subunit G
MSEQVIHRGKELSIIIDNKLCTGVFGQTILEIARKNDIYIPTMCYLPKVTPITSCRMCIVDIKGVDGPILSCQEKAINGAIITTSNDELFKQRQNIMKMYNVNHPLECGVCDKSGECNLQNKNLEFEIDSQEFAIKDLNRKIKKWGILGYDPNLCIMCEKCAHTCNEIIGSTALYIKPGGYKSIIDMKFTRCEQCGDCISVCPVGALVSNEFKYTANVWESNKIPATCAHCSSGCSLEYDVKYKEIKRVTNESDFAYLCGAGRFGFGFENKSSGKNKEAFDKTIKTIKISNAIRFNSYITNEEAKQLQTLKDKIGIKLINDDARAYQNFLNIYREVSGNLFYKATIKSIQDSDSIIVMGTRISRDNPGIKYSINIASKKQRAQFVYMHPIDDIALQNKYTQFIKYEASSEDAVMALLSSTLITNIPDEYKKYFDDLDIGYLSGEARGGEEELELISQGLIRRQNKTLIIGEDLYSHPNASNIAKFVGLIDKYTDFEIMLIPSQTNTLGVSLICSLDKDDIDITNVVGYNEYGDYIISDTNKNDLNIPALNQQEGTFVTVDKKVVNTNAALDFDGYCLNDIVNEFIGEKIKNTIDYTVKLPKENGFKEIPFDSFSNGYNNHGIDLRGYMLNTKVIRSKKVSIDEIRDINTYNGIVIYRCEPLNHFNKNTGKSLLLKSNNALRGSHSFSIAAKIKDGDTIDIKYNNKIMTKKFKLDSTIKGTIALYSTYDDYIIDNNIAYGYRFKQVQIERQEV